MNNTCPTCGSGYNLTAAHIGRQFACKKCGDTLLVTADGLRSGRNPSSVPQSPLPGGSSFETVGDQFAGAYRAAKSGGTLTDYLTFRKMIVPVVIQVLFWLGVAGSIVAGAFTIVMGLMAASQGGASTAVIGVVMGLAYMIVGPIFVRISCELTLIAFRIYESLGEIKELLQRQPR
ncbi:MAG: DUF4282 domain-containing protein [Gemmataceae bacterium]